MTLTKNRKKLWHPKTRTGCAVCRTRHLKCDETKPHCKQCLKAQLTCPGYSPLIRISDVGQPKRFSSNSEQNLFAFAHRQACEIYCQYMPYMKEFWVRTTAQLCELYPGFRHCFVALGAIDAAHQMMGRKPSDDGPSQLMHFGLEQQNKAIRAMVEDQPPIEMMIAFSVFSLAVSIWLERTPYPAMHIIAGISLVSEYEQAKTRGKILGSALVDGFLDPAFKKLHFEAMTYEDDYDTSTLVNESQNQLQFEMPDKFANPDEALTSCCMLLTMVVKITCEDKEIPRSAASSLNTAISTFSSAVHYSLAEPQSISADAVRKDFEILLVHARVMKIMLLASMPYNEMLYDSLILEFESIVSGVKVFVDMKHGEFDQTPNGLKITLGLLAPLFFVATKCRHAVLRNEAVELLHRSLRRERKWTSCLATQVARFVIEKEGQKLSDSPSGLVPLEKRIRLENVSFNQERHAMIIDFRYAKIAKADRLQRAELPYHPIETIHTNISTSKMSQKILKANLYSGMHAFIPSITCHCPRTASLLADTYISTSSKPNREKMLDEG